MAGKIFIWLLVLWVCTQTSFAQFNIGVGEKCLDYNHALLSKAIINQIGEERWYWLVENKVKLIFVFKVDTLGYVVDLKRFSSQNINISQTIIENFVISLQENKTRFFICYNNDTCLSDTEYLEILLESINKPDKIPSFYVFLFAPRHDWYLNYEKANQLNPISKLDFYLLRVNEALKYFESR